MIVNEKGLLKAMKSAAKGGYKVFADEHSVTLFHWNWYVHIKRENLPRSVLALLVEHIGFIPSEGDCLQVFSTASQAVMRDTMDEEVRGWSFGETNGEARMVPVLYKGRQIFQTEDRECYAVEPGALGLLTRYAAEKDAAVVLDGKRMIWVGNSSRVILPAARPKAGHGDDDLIDAWDALESTEWA
jgi:hypothetical protein